MTKPVGGPVRIISLTTYVKVKIIRAGSPNRGGFLPKLLFMWIKEEKI